MHAREKLVLLTFTPLNTMMHVCIFLYGCFDIGKVLER